MEEKNPAENLGIIGESVQLREVVDNRRLMKLELRVGFGKKVERSRGGSELKKI